MNENQTSLIAILVDDEASSRELLFRIVADHCPQVEVKACLPSVKEAVTAIRQYRPHIVFLDIEMPLEDGFALFSYFDEIDFSIIFVTAYDDYAVRAFEFAAVDYLLKPFRIDRLVNAVERVREKNQVKLHAAQVSVLRSYLGQAEEKLALPFESGFKIVNIKEIVRCTADRNYTLLSLDSGEKILVSKTLAKFEALLEQFNFLRVHRSHLINVDKIKGFVKGRAPLLLMSDESEVEVAPGKRESIMNRWNYIR
ncbi:MAG: LytTR family DNA-binding domain-containing protein [Bacteroidota bacterium]